MPRIELGRRAKTTYATAMHGVGRLVFRGSGTTPPDPRHRVQHWLASLTVVHDPLGLTALDVPWWTYRAIDAVERWLADRTRPIRVFEWGPGASTVWLARRTDEVFSIEHVAEFAAQLAPVLAAYPGVTLRTVAAPASTRPAVRSAKQGHAGLDFAGYAAAIDTVPGTFDLIVIDGRARAACLERAVGRLAADGLIVFDNSRRRRYRAAIEGCGLVERRCRGLTPTLPYPEQTSLLTARR